MKRQITIAVIAVFLLGAAFTVRTYWSAVRPPFLPAPTDITHYLPDDSVPAGAVNETNIPLTLPPGFSISIFAKNLPGARVILFDYFGNLWVSRAAQGAVTLLEVQNGRVASQSDIFEGMRKPHGLAFDPAEPLLLYIAEENRIRRFATYSEDRGEDVLALPAGEGHFTRTIGFGPDGELYVSLGSSCNVCEENDKQRGTIMRYDPLTQRSQVFARGLRNAVFFTWDRVGRLWATEMGRDWLGDDLPPDEINVVAKRSPLSGLELPHYGWPYCYGQQIRDAEFEPTVEFDCRRSESAVIDIPAHSAPLGLGFVPASSAWPEDYWYDLIVAFHGSWNRSVPTGYKVVRYRFDESGNYQGVEDFITGWLTPEGALGRPVDILIQPDGLMYLSDDKAGVIYRVRVSPR